MLVFYDIEYLTLLTIPLRASIVLMTLDPAIPPSIKFYSLPNELNITTWTAHGGN